ncbi:LLM class F420-dependent oxidoreductase [Lentzea sp. NBRC 105346]|uniref:TIGR03620 family F420-dependent LLM class oxidoreductase n=1 Tax=Lentzea sp. NBRC 105346 TaxID=3032205 RepID=UPI0024A056CA|nr:TIGR03620 family F420-dependent LLM class oxidoreductase [Lentzea sp. NBRC 105346]GLZ33248.1 LLM class F420-dependent oxidoreductase [Lentzea sp. NBRC 105346]
MFGEYGVWLRQDVWVERPDLAAELEEQGFGTVWVGGSPEGDLVVPEQLLGHTRTITVATGIVNVWTAGAADVTRSFHRVGNDRLVLGVGAGHHVNRGYTKPYTKLVSYLDELDVPSSRLVLAALGPKVLRLAAERTAGAHPYLGPRTHTELARSVIGDRELAPEVTVVVEDDPVPARAAAREFLKTYLALPNYTNNWLRHGFTEADFANGGSDRLVDELIAWGTPEEIAARLEEHRRLGASHVAVQSLNGHYDLLAKALRLR